MYDFPKAVWQWGHSVLSDLVVAYLFLGGAGAGACFVASVLALRSPRGVVANAEFAPYYGRFYVAAYSCAAACLLVGAACLSFDLGRFDALVALLFSPRVSYIAVGSFAVLACFVLSLALALAWLRIGWRGSSGRRLRVVFATQAVALLVSFCVMAYTGLLLQSIGSVPLWNSPFVPVLFVASSASCGCALAVLSAHAANMAKAFDRALSVIAKCDAALIAVEVACLVALTVSALHVDAANQTQATLLTSAENLVLGDFAPAFWLGLIAVGLAAPLLFDSLWAKSGHSSRFALAACACVLVGGIVLRVCLVSAGAHPEISTL